MNIALVCDYSLDYLGGAQTAFREQARALVAAGHRVVVIAPRAGHAAGDRTDTGATATEWIDTPFSIPGLGLPYLRNTAALRSRVARMLARHQVEVVHLHSEFGLAAATISAARELRVPIVHTVHTFFWNAGGLPTPVGRAIAAAVRRFHFWMTGQLPCAGAIEGRPADAALRRMTLATASRADVVISPSEHQARRLRTAGLGRVDVIPNTVGSPTRRVRPLDDISGTLRVVWIGRCAPEKRLPAFVSACVRALDILEPGALEIEIVGDGPQLRRAERLAARHPQISFAGRVTGEAVADKLERSHLAALTSFGFDNQPMTVVEALAAARPVLYVDPELREGLYFAGLLCRDETVEAMTATLVELASDPTRVVRASERARVAFEQFSPGSFVDAIEAVYRTLQPATIQRLSGAAGETAQLPSPLRSVRSL